MRITIAIWISVLSWGCATAASNGEKAFLSAEGILKQWESTYLDISSMHIVVNQQLLSAKEPEGSQGKPIEYLTVDRLEKGIRYYLKYSTKKEGFDNPEGVIEYAFDGRLSSRYKQSDNLGVVEPGLTGKFIETDNLLKQYMLMKREISEKYAADYPDGIPLFSKLMRDGLANSSVQVLADLVSVAGTPCHVVEITLNNQRDFHVIWVSHEKGMLPLKYRFYDGGLEEEIQIKEIGYVDSNGKQIWYPVKAERKQIIGTRYSYHYQLSTQIFQPNVEVRQQDFRVRFPEGADVLDRGLGISYKTGVSNIDSASVYDKYDQQAKKDNKISAAQPENKNNVNIETNVEETKIKTATVHEGGEGKSLPRLLFITVIILLGGGLGYGLMRLKNKKDIYHEETKEHEENK